MLKSRVNLYLLIFFTLFIIILGIVYLNLQSSIDPCRWNFYRTFPLKWEGPAENASNAGPSLDGLKKAQENVELDVIGATPTAILEAVLTSLPTLDFVPAVADQNANCRYGPSTIFHITAYLRRGEAALVQARSRMGDWYLVSIQPGGIFCWVWRDLLIVEADISTIPVNPGPPPPTKKAPEPRKDSKKVGCSVISSSIPQWKMQTCPLWTE